RTAVLHHNGAPVVPLDVGQRLHQDPGLLQRRDHVVYSALIRTYSADRSLVSTVAVASPRFIAIRISTSRSNSVARAFAGSPGPVAPFSHNSWPPSHTSTTFGSNGMPDVPSAARTRPQFGSAPLSAHRRSTE